MSDKRSTNLSQYYFPLKFHYYSKIESNGQDVYALDGQTKSKLFFQADVSSKKRTNEFDFTTMRLVFIRFLEEIEDAEKTFRNYLTFRKSQFSCT